MPILEVKPTSSELLQHIANSLGKARKVVIITGAGISTNSGIPDFRSENGLYSLIQAQFERAEATHPKDIEGQATDFTSSGRPTKRRRISRGAECSGEQEGQSYVIRASNDCKSQEETNAEKLSSYAGDDLLVKPGVEATPSKHPLRRLAHTRPGLRPILHRNITQSSTQSSSSQDLSLSTPQLSSASSQTEEPSLHEVKETGDSQVGVTTPRAILSETFSSSPLSSPPPILFDPYENANSSTQSSDISDSEETQNSLDLFSSQTSNSSLRNMKGRDLFDCNIWADPLKTSVFYRFATTLRQKVKDVEPTTTHRFIARLRDVGKLARVYTQNIDEIEKKIGLSTDLKNGAGNRRRKSTKQQVMNSEKEFKENQEPPRNDDGPNRVDTDQASPNSEVSGRSNTRSALAPDRGVECVFLHGSLNSLRCFVCGKLCDWDEDGRESCTMLGEQPECPHCAGATAARQEKGKRALGVGKLRPDIVLYGEEHPQSDLISPIVQHDLSAGPDLLLILGTSLRVHGLKVMVKEFAKAVHKKGGQVVFINLTKPSESAWGDIIDYWIEWDCDAWVDDLKNRKPHLWLSPNEILEFEKQRREALAEKKKRENLFKKRESIAEKKRVSLGEKRRHTIELDKPRPPPKNPSSMRNDYQCGAYVVWEIFQTLAKIGDRPFDNLGYKPPQQPPPAAPPPIPDPASTFRPRPTITKAKKARKSAPAALAAPTNSEIKPRPAVKAKFLATCNSRDQYAKAAQGLARSGKSPTPIRMAELNRTATLHGKKATPPYIAPSSITAAVKIHPRQRKRKLIEGVPVGITASRTEKHTIPLSAPLRGIGREVKAENRLAPPPTYSTLPSKGPVLPPFHPGWERSPPARIKPLEPSLNVSPRSPLANLAPIVQPKSFAVRQATHPMFFSDPLVKLRYETTNYRKPPRGADAVICDKTPSPSDQLRWELAQQEALEGAQVLEGLRRSQ
ncbi:DHS-like NAD/FAD-binding domain-containing protein [Annulohypoxylon moriforme]|nr:DHS-like NAD/FAD-binding domain-containing protein [Annulohypoxylon moriforme]